MSFLRSHRRVQLYTEVHNEEIDDDLSVQLAQRTPKQRLISLTDCTSHPRATTKFNSRPQAARAFLDHRR
jgi:hypothetical protein